MSRSAPGPLLRFARAGWNAVNFTRRLVFNAIFLFIGLIVLVALFSGRPKLPERSALVIAPQGQVVEQFSADPFERALSKAMNQPLPETQLRDLVRALEAAATDSRIERVVIRPDQMTGIGFAALEELARAVTEFRKSGKQLVAYADGMDQKQYYLAALADEVYLHPDGMVLLEGLSRYRAYYREALEDKLGVDVHLFRVGEYKSAAEPYILDAASPESREADLYWMNDLWRHFLADVARLRSLDADALQAGIDDFAARVESVAGDMGKLALEQKLVDGLVTQDQFRDLMVERGVEDTETHSFRQVSMDAYLGFVDRERPAFDARPKVAIVVAQGEIAAGDLPPGTVGGVSTSRLLRDAREDADVKAVVLRVDSPGGGVFPSEQIRREVELIRAAGKPVVVSMGNVAASGGYWISMNADAIYAQPTTITGSIGIFGMIPTFQKPLAKYLGVTIDGVGTTWLSGAIRPDRALDPRAGELVQLMIDRGYEEFLERVAKARNMSRDEVDRIARGRIWSGADAKSIGLVDQLGGLEEAIAAAAGRAGLEGEPKVRYLEPERTWKEKLAEQLFSAAIAVAGEAPRAPRGLSPARSWKEIERRLEPLLALDDPTGLVAHCLCEVE